MEVVFADAQQDNAKQVADVENFLRQRVDLLMISPNEAKPLTPVVERAFKAGVPVVVIDRGIEGDSFTTFIGADNYEIGRQAGGHIAEILNGQGAIVEIRGLPGSPPAVDRSRGMHDAIAAHPGLRIIHSPVANWLREEAMAQMEMALAAHPKIDLVYAHNDPMAVGAWLAAKAKGREREMKFIGIDALPGLDGGRQAVADGKLDATFVYPTGGREAVEIAARILAGEQVPHRVALKTEMIAR
jgi:ribose transport system substrate-binding protein